MISEASKRIGVESHTLRYWEDELDLPVSRNEMGHRYYKDSDIEMLKMIKQLKEQGFQLKAIKLLLPNLNQLDNIDSNTMVKHKEELNGKVDEMKNEENLNLMNEEDLNGKNEEDLNVIEKEKGTSLVASNENNEMEPQPQDKMSQFKAILNQIILSALKENNGELSEEICTTVTNNVIKEMHFLMRLQEEKEEERFRKFDATLRDYQRSRLQAAAVLDGRARKKSKFFKKHKVYI